MDGVSRSPSFPSLLCILDKFADLVVVRLSFVDAGLVLLEFLVVDCVLLSLFALKVPFFLIFVVLVADAALVFALSEVLEVERVLLLSGFIVGFQCCAWFELAFVGIRCFALGKGAL